MRNDECTCEQSHSRIKVQERGRSAVFLNLSRAIVLLTRIDGCVVKNQTAADWVVTWTASRELIVELKGRNVEHACDQIWHTAQLVHRNCPGSKLAGLIVCSQFPRFNTAIQKAKTSFARQFSGPLHVVSRNCEYDVDHVFSFRGPHRQ
jgi:hypothetical protein